VKKSLRVLIVEDSKVDAELIALEFTHDGYAIKWERVETSEAMKKALEKRKWDIVISDYSMPRFSGLEALKLVQEKTPDLPFILISGVIGEDLAVEAMKEGAHDYIMKDNMKRLLPAVERELKEATIRFEKKKAEEELRLKNNAVESAAEAIVIANAEGEIVYVNEAFSEMYGLNADKAIGKHFSCVASEDPSMQSVLEALQIDRVWDGELKNCNVNGMEFDVNLTAQMVMNEKGNPAYIIGIIRDITEWKKAEGRIKHLNELLDSIRSVNRLIAREKDISTLIKRACENFVKTTKYDAVWIALLGDEESVTKVEKAGSGISFLEKLKEVEDNNKLDCVRKTVKTNRIQTFEDPNKDCPECPFRKICPGRMIISPMSYENKIYGTLAISYPEVFTPDIEEKKLLKEVSDDLGFAFHSIELEEENKKNKGKLKESLEKAQKFLDGTVKALSSVVEKRDPYTAGHQKRVAQLAVALGKELGLNDEKLEALRMASLLHDIGKIHIGAEVLNKPTKLDKLEMSMIKTHSTVGYEILKSVDFPGPVAEIVLQHHERLDGSGYPKGLSAAEISLEAKILAVADVIEAYTSKRPYRLAYSFDDAIKKVSEGKGTLYDREVVEKCIKLFKEKDFSFSD